MTLGHVETFWNSHTLNIYTQYTHPPHTQTHTHFIAAWGHHMQEMADTPRMCVHVCADVCARVY